MDEGWRAGCALGVVGEAVGCCSRECMRGMVSFVHRRRSTRTERNEERKRLSFPKGMASIEECVALSTSPSTGCTPPRSSRRRTRSPRYSPAPAGRA